MKSARKSLFKNLFAVIGVLLMVSVSGAFDYPKDHSNLFELGAGYRASLMCSCIFVLNRDESQCDSFSAPSPNLTWTSIDAETMTVTTWFLWEKQQAKFIDEKSGCLLL